MAKNIKTRKGSDGFHYPYTSPDLVVDENGKSATTKFNEIDSQFKDIANNIKLNRGEDGTEKIQTALNSQGIINVYIDDFAYISETLLIKSNTELNIKTGILKEKTNTKNYMLKNSDSINGNINIKINGIFDLDGKNNLATSTWNGVCILLNNVKNLVIDNMKILNSNKYAILLVNILDSNIDTIEFDTYSDGLHFQPPINNITINKLFGKTGDDMLAFTLGDYPDHEISNEGMIENVIVNTIKGINAKNLLKITGSGKNSSYWCKNIKINNMCGTVTQEAIFIQDDGSNLMNTKIENIVIDNINVEGGTNPLIFVKPTGGGDLTIHNIVAKPNGKILCSFSGSTLDKVNIDNVILRDFDEWTSGTVFDFSNVTNIGNLNIKNVDTHLLGNITIFKLGGKIDNVFINDSKIKMSTTTGAGRVLELAPNLEAKSIVLSNNYIENITTMVKSDCNITLQCSNNVFKGTINTPFYITSGNFRLSGCGNNMDDMLNCAISTGANFSANDFSFKLNYEKITNPQNGDVVFSTRRLDNQFEVGLIVYDGTKWRNLFN